jgi:hypothetical protein
VADGIVRAPVPCACRSLRAPCAMADAARGESDAAAAAAAPPAVHRAELVGPANHPRCFRCHRDLRRLPKKSARGAWPNRHCASATCSAAHGHVPAHSERAPCLGCCPLAAAAAAAAAAEPAADSLTSAQAEAARLHLLAAQRKRREATPRTVLTRAGDKAAHVQLVTPTLAVLPEQQQPHSLQGQAYDASGPSPRHADLAAATAVPERAHHKRSADCLVNPRLAAIRSERPCEAQRGPMKHMPPLCARGAHASAAAVHARVARSGLAAGAAADVQGAHPDSIRFYSTGELHPQSSFHRRRFVLDYSRSGASAAGADPLPALLKQLGAQVIPELQQSSDELIVDQEDAQLSWRAQRTRGISRYAHLVLAGGCGDSRDAPLDGRLSAARRLKCAVRPYAVLLQQAQRRRAEEFDFTPCIIVGDAAGMYKPSIALFPMVEARAPSTPRSLQRADVRASRTGAAAAVVAQASAVPQMVHTFPTLDWDAPAGRSPFVNGRQRADQAAEQARKRQAVTGVHAAVKAGDVPCPTRVHAAPARAAVVLPAPALLWCEVCRVEVATEQAHHNTPEHQHRFDSQQQLAPLLAEMKAQRKWNVRNHLMAIVWKEMVEREAQEARELAKQPSMSSATAAGCAEQRAMVGV